MCGDAVKLNEVPVSGDIFGSGFWVCVGDEEILNGDIFGSGFWVCVGMNGFPVKMTLVDVSLLIHIR